MTGGDAAPELVIMKPLRPVRAVALLLPGGSGDEPGPGDRYRPGVLRMLPFGWDLRVAGARRGLAVGLLRYRMAGWKHGAAGAAEDARWALDRLESRVGPVPVVLIGHSMGGRTALAVADMPNVVGVVALAPWIVDELSVEALRRRTVVLAHGAEDRVTDPAATAAFADRARAAGIDVDHVVVHGDGHAMIKRPLAWQRLVRAHTSAILAARSRPG